MNVTRTFDLLTRYADKFPDKADALAGKVNGKWIKYSSSDYIENSNLVSYGLMSLGVKKGDTIVTISNNRPEWNFLDMGMAQIGAIHVPLFTTLDQGGFERILKHAEAKYVFLSDKSLYSKIQPLLEKVKSIKTIYTINDIDGLSNWKDVLELGKQTVDKYKAELETIKQSISPRDCVSIIYTSGTTGNSKGVMLAHENLVSNAIAVSKVFKLKPEHRYLSILPVCHVGERMAVYQTQYSGCSLYYGENLATIASDLLEIKPHGFGAVPRVLEKVYDKIIAKGAMLTGLKRKLFFWALNLGHNYKTDGENGIWYEFQLKIARKLIFSKWQEAMGGNIVSIGIGGAALQPRLERVFWGAGIKLLNMYGLTETSPVITINRDHLPDLKLGTVGAVIDGVQIKIAADGEILCKGPNVMLGYYKDEEATLKAIDNEGWFHTGDIGLLEDGRFLKITDRKKEIFKLSNGKYVSPLAVENIFKESIFVDQIMVIGEGEKFTSALISPNMEALYKWWRDNDLPKLGKTEMVEHEAVQKKFKSIAREFNKHLSKDEQVKRQRVVADEWTPDSGELSPTLKLKRKVVFAKYKPVIEDIYHHNEEITSA